MSDSDATRFPPLSVSRTELLVEGKDDDFRHLVHNLLDLSVTLQSIRAGFGAILGLSGIHYTLMMSIAHLNDGNGTGIKQLAEHLNFSGAFVTTEINSLVRMNLLDKKTNLEDRRRVNLTLTSSGKAAIYNIASITQGVNDKLFSGLDKEDFSKLVKLSYRLRVDSKKALSLLNSHFDTLEESR